MIERSLSSFERCYNYTKILHVAALKFKNWIGLLSTVVQTCAMEIQTSAICHFSRPQPQLAISSWFKSCLSVESAENLQTLKPRCHTAGKTPTWLTALKVKRDNVIQGQALTVYVSVLTPPPSPKTPNSNKNNARCSIRFLLRQNYTASRNKTTMAKWESRL